jgi:hypothetical protein
VSKAREDRRSVGLSVSGRLHDAVIERSKIEERPISAIYERAVRLYLRRANRRAAGGDTSTQTRASA